MKLRSIFPKAPEDTSAQRIDEVLCQLDAAGKRHCEVVRQLHDSDPPPSEEVELDALEAG